MTPEWNVPERDENTGNVWPDAEEVRAMSADQLADLQITLLEDLNGSDSEMVGPFRRWDDEINLFVYLDEVGIVHNSDLGRFILKE